MKHWMWDARHGYEGRRMRTGELAEWCGVKSSGTVTTWISKGGVWRTSGLTYCEEARARSGCTPDCDSGFGDLVELRARYAAALRDGDAERAAAQQRSRRRTVVPAAYTLTRQEVDRRLPSLAQAQKGALRSLETVAVNQFGPGLDRLMLAEVRVERAAERRVLKHIERQLSGTAPGQAAALVGEPGVGKSCSLWGVHQALSRRQDICLVLLSATSLLAGPGGPADLRPHELPVLLEEHRKQTAGTQHRTVLLLDTADLLLHQMETAHDFVELITVLRSTNTAVALACRKGEAGLLKQRWDTEYESGAYTSILSDIPVDLYDAGPDDARRGGWAPDSELAQAIDAYARVYAPARDDGDGSLPQMRRALADAAARGLPLGKLIRHPLHLRMVFDLYAPVRPRGFDLDVAGLFHDYWTQRVDQDMRHAVAAPGVEPEEQAIRLGRAAAELGLATLLEGTIELRRKTVRDLVASRLGVDEAQAAHWIGLLQRRGVLSEPFPGRLRFHHQAIGEYAAGRGLAEAPAGLEAAVDRITEYPQDLYLAEAARHAFHYSDRAHAHKSSCWYSRLAPLARASSTIAQETFLRILAGLRHAPDAALADAVPLIEDLDNGRLLAEHYLARLQATSQPAEHIWPRLLRTIWNIADAAQRREVLRTLTVLIRQQRATTAAFLHGLPAAELPRHALAHDLSTLMRHLHEDDAADPADYRGRTAATMARMLDDAFVQQGAPLEHALGTLAELAAQWPYTYGEVCRGLPKRLGEVPEKVARDIDKIVTSAAVCWAAAQAHERVADTLQALHTCLEELAGGVLPAATHQVVLRGVASTLCHPGVRIAESTLREELTNAAACVPDHLARKVIARYLLRPLLVAGDTPAGRTAREWCRAQTTPKHVQQVPQSPATALALAALGRQVPAPVIAASLPDDRRSKKPRAETLLPWTTAPWDLELTAAAAAGGHHLATHALDHLIKVTPPSPEARPQAPDQEQGQEEPCEDGKRSKRKRRGRGRSARRRLPSPREEVVSRVPEAPGLLLPWLLRDAQRWRNTDALVRFSHAREIQLPAEHADQLGLIASYLMKQENHQATAAAHRLTARMISRGLTPLGTPDSLVDQLDALRTSAIAQTELLEAVTQAITNTPTLWDLPTARKILTTALDNLVERATTMAATIARPQRGQEAYMLTGHAAHLLKVRLAVLDARRKIAENAHDIGLDELRSLAFEQGHLCVPRGHSLTKPSSMWPHRFNTMPRLCIDLHEAGRPQDAERILRSAVTAATTESGPSARWRNFAWNPWRPYLRLLVSERSHLYDLLIDYGPRDHQLARHLLEVAGQALSNISEELHRLLTDPRWPTELLAAARRTASWAGRDGANLRWDTVYDDIETAARQLGSGR
ncbi:hypothetical protein ACFVHS_38455 [Streptomyces sp. NPDC057746]|uniref:hypothetical protein n=1 Tax=Streptomyces sp. NPDC057746 TaxID=3346237 RepID=UPI0036925D48